MSVSRQLGVSLGSRGKIFAPDECDVPGLLLQPNFKPVLPPTETALGRLYSAEFASTIDHDHTLEPVRRLQAHVRDCNTLDAMLYIDTKSWLPDDLLIKADKMTMANSLELRVPLLDHKVLEFAAALPTNLKVRGRKTKYLAKKALGHRVPKSILNRRKAGFPVPYESWLRKDMRNWVNDVLCDWRTDESRLFLDLGCPRVAGSKRR